MCLQNLRPLCHSSQSVGDSLLIKMALVNARSLCNKMFILRDFFTSKSLDVLFVTETWLSSGNLSPFADLAPLDCKFINSPRVLGRGGGLASVFKNSLLCRPVEFEHFSSFELQAFKLDLVEPVLCVLVYRPPKFNKDFIHDFSFFFINIFFIFHT